MKVYKISHAGMQSVSDSYHLREMLCLNCCLPWFKITLNARSKLYKLEHDELYCSPNNDFKIHDKIESLNARTHKMLVFTLV